MGLHLPQASGASTRVGLESNLVILFPEFPLRAGEIDPDFAEEQTAALAAGFEVALYRQESIIADAANRVLRFAPPRSTATPAMLRGWMLRDSQYEPLWAALNHHNYQLINPPSAYAQAHYLPEAYPLLAGHTPQSVWTDTPDIDAAWQLYQGLRDGDAIAKDHVKSVKHRWLEACFIPAGTEEGRFREILQTLRDDRDKQFEKGFVLRRFVPLASDGRDMRGHPADRELRLFFLDGQILVHARPQFMPPDEKLDTFCSLARRFQSRFLSMDVAETAAGDWIVIEVGDGGVSGLPASLMADVFYGAIRSRLRQ